MPLLMIPPLIAFYEHNRVNFGPAFSSDVPIYLQNSLNTGYYVCGPAFVKTANFSNYRS